MQSQNRDSYAIHIVLCSYDTSLFFIVYAFDSNQFNLIRYNEIMSSLLFSLCETGLILVFLPFAFQL